MGSNKEAIDDFLYCHCSSKSPHFIAFIFGKLVEIELTKYLWTYVQWRAKVFDHPLKSHNFFKINPNDLSFFEKLKGLVC